jgi:hypothetical protein
MLRFGLPIAHRPIEYRAFGANDIGPDHYGLRTQTGSPIFGFPDQPPAQSATPHALIDNQPHNLHPKAGLDNLGGLRLEPTPCPASNERHQNELVVSRLDAPQPFCQHPLHNGVTKLAGKPGNVRCVTDYCPAYDNVTVHPLLGSFYIRRFFAPHLLSRLTVLSLVAAMRRVQRVFC